MDKNNYLTVIKHFFQEAQLADLVNIYPTATERTLFEKMSDFLSLEKNITSSITLLINEVKEVTPLASQEHDITLQSIAYLMVISTKTTSLNNRLFALYAILEKATLLLNNQRWGLRYTYPPSEIQAMDLYGLSYDKDELITAEGWNPSIQAHAKTLYQKKQKDSYPNNLTLWFLSWKQTLRLGPNPD